MLHIYWHTFYGYHATCTPAARWLFISDSIGHNLSYHTATKHDLVLCHACTLEVAWELYSAQRMGWAWHTFHGICSACMLPIPT